MESPMVGGPVGDHPKATTIILSAVGYAAVVGVFAVPSVQALFPELSEGQVNLLAHAIAVVNTLAVTSLAAGWYWIRNDEVRKHAHAMVSAFV
ncbi:MAG: putative membrane protein [uncultured archaeon A07HN63]|nr:MAG: putative membrane protein [uncultured archaeon A07HN63]